jgi:hypothetical protein
MTERTKTKVSLYYSRKAPSGRLTIVRNTRRPSMMESLSTPYAQGIYTGAAGVGLITGMAMMGRRRGYEAAIKGISANSGRFSDLEQLDEFGYPCGNSFTSDRRKCYVDPKTGTRLKKPITRSIYDKIMKSGGKAAQTLYKDREDRIRSSRRDGAKGWKKSDPIVNNPVKSASELDRQKQIETIKSEKRNVLATPLMSEGAISPMQVGMMSSRQKQKWSDNAQEKMKLESQMRELALSDEVLTTREKQKALKDAQSKISGLNRNLDVFQTAFKTRSGKPTKSAQATIDIHQSDLDNIYKKYPELVKDAKYPPRETPKLTLDKVETSIDREKFAAQQLADAKARGDKKDIKSWEDAGKSARKSRVNESISKSKQSQGTLFDTTMMDDSPLMRSLREKSGDFGYACGSTFIPDNSKCYTDPKTRARLTVPLTKAQIEKVRKSSPGAEKLYSAQEAENKGRLRGGSIPAEYQAAARSTGATKVLPSGIAEVDPKKLNLDPKRFQYKIVSGATGESGSLSDVKKWDSNIAGIQLAWHDPADDKTYVINGHNRTNLAKKLGVETVTTRFIKADNAKQARSIGALTNISEGSGNSLDAAKFFRDSNLTQDDLTKKGIPLKSQVATEGIALSKLNDGLFDKVIQGDLSKERGTIIGRNLTDGKEQSELVDLIDKQEKKGKKITNEGISELAEMVKSAPKQQAEGGFLGLLGFSPEAKSLAVEKAEIQAHIKRQLSTDKKLFGVVGRNRNAAKLEREGNKIDVDKSQQISQRAERALATFDREKKYSGKVADEINSAAARIANGEKSAKVRDEAYRNVLELINN